MKYLVSFIAMIGVGLLACGGDSGAPTIDYTECKAQETAINKTQADCAVDETADPLGCTASEEAQTAAADATTTAAATTLTCTYPAQADWDTFWTDMAAMHTCDGTTAADYTYDATKMPDVPATVCE